MALARESKYVLTAEDRTRQAFASLERNFNQTNRLLGTLRRLTAVAFSIAGLKVFIDKNIEAERASNRLTAVINAQGHAAGFTRGQLDEMADSLAAATQFDDEDFRNGQATLLKFGNVYNDVFERALKASADLAAFQGTDLAAGVEAVGKALQNPVEGLRQLQAQIGKLDPAQRKMLENMIQQNNVVGAQNKLLDILNGKIGGTAALMNSGFAKGVSDSGKAFEELLEALGKTDAVKGTVTGFFDFLTKSLRDMKSIIEAGDWFGGLLFLLGGRGHDVSAQSAMALEIQNVERNLKDQQAKAGQTTDPVHARNVVDLTEKLKKLNAEYQRLYGITGAKPAPKPTINMGPKKFGGDALPGLNLNLLGIGPEFFEAAQLGQEFGAQALSQQIELVGRANEVIREKALSEAFGAEQLAIYRDAQRAASDSVEVYIKSIDNETRLMGTTTAGRQRLLDIMRLEDEQRDLNAKGTGFAAEEYERLIAKLKAARDAQDALNQSWAFGAGNALAQYQETVENVAASTESLVSNAFRGMEDALLAFVKTGKLSFHDLAESIVSDMVRIRIQQSITGPLAAFLGNLIPGVSAGGVIEVQQAGFGGQNIQARAAGGPVSAMSPYWVGEQGPELFVPRTSGSIVANGGAGNVTINQTIKIDSRSDQGTILLAMTQAKEAAKAEIRNEFYRGGRVAKVAGSA